MRVRDYVLPLLAVGVTAVVVACSDGPAGPKGPDGPGKNTVPPASISLDVRGDTLTAIGDTLVLSATAYDGKGGPIANAELTWETSAAGVATVTPQGVVIAQTNGTVTITVRAGSVSDSTSITVAQRAARLTFRLQPSTVLQGEPLPGAIEVVVADARGNLVLMGSDDVELSLTPSGTLEGTATAQAVDGVATFNDLGVVEAGAGYRLEARYGALQATLSNFFDVHLAFAKLSGGGLHTCGITIRGETYCWGENSGGRVGDGTTGSRSRPVLVASAGTLHMVDAGSPTTWALDSDGNVYGWGDDTLTPTQLPTPAPFDTITTRWHTCALAANGTAYCWGIWPSAFGAGQSYESVPSPTVAMGGEAVVEIGTGNAFTCALHTDRTAWCAGNNPKGELGNGTTTFSDVPTPVLGKMAFSRLDVGHEFTCGITVSGLTYCWGANSAGQLGNPAAGDHSAQPVEVAGGHRFSKLSLGQEHACGLTGDGTAYCWGSPIYGMLGVDRAQPATEPVAVSGGLRFREITAASFHTCGIATDGYAYCWGFNTNGELGDGGQPAGPTPRRVAAPWL
jgi:alpha-tubulin suppressor-like RCC1 family protein